MGSKTIRIGVDVGGTNTDICAIDETSGALMVYKLPSSLYDQSESYQALKLLPMKTILREKKSADSCTEPQLQPMRSWKEEVQRQP